MRDDEDGLGGKAICADLSPRSTYHIVQGSAPVLLQRPPVPFRKVKTSAMPMAHPQP